jgi:uncharacterized damage-inducible protein DinB
MSMNWPLVALNQLIEGEDYETPQQLLGDLTPEQATIKPAGAPYTIATQAAHFLFWHQRWLNRLNDVTNQPITEKNSDFPNVTSEEWPALRDRMLEALKEAAVVAEGFERAEEAVGDNGTRGGHITAMAIHGSYHLGQIALLRQLLGAWPPANAPDFDVW